MTNGDGNPPAHIMGLFTAANYRFSSVAPGRSSTLYFEDGTGHRGRYRRTHPLGPELVFQGNCRRMFVASGLVERVNVLADIENHNYARTDEGVAWNQARLQKMAQIHSLLQTGDPKAALYHNLAALNFVPGVRLFDFDGASARISSGTVDLNDPGALAFFGSGGEANLQNYDGPWSIW